MTNEEIKAYMLSVSREYDDRKARTWRDIEKMRDDAEIEALERGEDVDCGTYKFTTTDYRYTSTAQLESARSASRQSHFGQFTTEG